MYVRTSVGDEDLLAVHLDRPIVELGHTGQDSTQVASGLGLGEVHAALQLTRGETREIGTSDLVAPILFDVARHAPLEADHGHEARVRPRNHLDHDVAQQRGQAVAAVLLAHREAHEAALAQLVVGRADVRRRLGAAVGREFGRGGPVLSGRRFEAFGESGGRFQNGPVGADLRLGVDGRPPLESKQGVPVDETIEVEVHSRYEVIGHLFRPPHRSDA